MDVSVSILSANDKIGMVRLLNDSSCDYIHIDVMDGNFVSNCMFSLSELENINRVSTKKLDVHLMVSNPDVYIKCVGNLDMVEYITIHCEIDKDIMSILKLIKSYGKKCGLSIKPNTSIYEVVPYLDVIDMILIMSVEPGRGGQKFINGTLNRIKLASEIAKDKVIAVDGGINDSNASLVKDNGASLVVSGSFVVNALNYDDKINSLR